MRIGTVVAAYACVCGILAGGAGADDPGVVVSPGAQPYTETWTEMVMRSPFRPNPDLPEPPPRTLSDVPGAGSGQVRTVPGWSVRGPGPAPCPTQSGGWVGNTFANVVAGVGASGSPPSPAVAVGPNHILEIGGGAVSIYDRQGTRLSMVGQAAFFTMESGGVTYPRNGAIRSRAMFHRAANRFFVTAIERGEPVNTHNHIMLAVSRTDDPTGAWDKYVLPIGEPTAGGVTWFTDWCQIGLDYDGFTVGALLFSSEGSTISRVITTRWSPLVYSSTPALGTVWKFDFTGTFGPPIPATSGSLSWWEFGSDWIVNITNEPALQVRRIVWTYSSATSTWTASIDANVASLPVPTFSAVHHYTVLGGSAPTLMWDYRVTSVYRTGNTLWTCNTVGTNISGTETNTDRNGIDWTRIALGSSVTTGTRSIAARGRVVDTAMVYPISYCFPALAVTPTNRVALVFCGGGASMHMSVFACGRLPGDPIGAMRPVTLVKLGESLYSGPLSSGRFTWGYYSGIAPDPLDGSTVWSAVQYASTGFIPNPNWGVHLGRLVTRPPPTPVSTSPATLPRGYEGPLTINSAAPDGEAIVDDWQLPRHPTARFGSGQLITGPTGDGDIRMFSDGAVESVIVPNTAPLGGVGATITNADGQSAASAGPIVTIVEPAIANDWCAGAQVLTPAQLPFDQMLDLSAATPSPSSSGTSDVWYTLTPNVDGKLEVRLSSMIPGLEYAIGVRSSCDGASTTLTGVGNLTLRVAPGIPVYIQLLSHTSASFYEPVRLQVALHPVASLQSPCDTAPMLTVDVPYAGTIIQNGASTPQGQGYAIHRLVPPRSGWHRMYSSGYAQCAPLDRPCNPSLMGYGIVPYNYIDENSDLFWLEAGREYMVWIDSAVTAPVSYTLTVRSAASFAGDDCIDAVPVALPSVVAFDTAGAMPPWGSYATTSCGSTTGIAMHQDRWYRVIAPRNGTVGLIVRSQHVATGARRIAVYTAPNFDSPDYRCQSGQLQRIIDACAGSPATPQAEITFPVVAGTHYFIQIASTSPTASTSGEMEIAFTPASTSSYACCLQDGTCAALSGSACYNMNGTLNASQTTCVPPGSVVTSTVAVLTQGTGTVAIPDANAASTVPGVVELTGTVQIPGGGRVQSVQASFGSLNHTYAGDLVIRLHHDGRSADLVNRPARTSANVFGSSANFAGAYSFIDGLPQSVWPVAAALTNTASNIPATGYLPGTINNINQSLSAVFDGASVNGEWTVRIEDLVAQDTGSCSQVQLTITYQPGPLATCGDVGACCWSGGTECFVAKAADCYPESAQYSFLGVGSTCSAAACPPVGDVCSTAKGIWPLNFPITFDYIDLSTATTSASDPSATCNVPPGPIAQSVWYSVGPGWPTGQTLHVRVDELTPFDSIVAAFTSPHAGGKTGGLNCAMLTPVACANEPEPLTIEVPITSENYHAIVVGCASPGLTAGKAKVTFSWNPIVPSVVCCRGAACSIEAEPSCTGGGGTVMPTLSCGPTSGCDVVCCRGPICAVETAASCASGGSPLAGAAACGPTNPCPIVCCRFGQCTLETTAACAVDGGQALASNTCGIDICIVYCCRGTTCTAVAPTTCTGAIAGSMPIIRPSCGPGNSYFTCCFADYNHDGLQTIDDLFLYFNAYFTSSPMADFGGNGASQPTIDDLFLYINAYFGTCS